MAQLDLLRNTIQRAVASTCYYAETYRDLDLDLRSIDDLRRFPLLTKDTAMRRNVDLLAPNTLPEYVRWTGGTTSAKSRREPLRRFQTEEERQWWIRLHSSLAEEIQGTRPLTVRIVSMEHGLDFPGALAGVFSLPLEKPAHFYALLRILKESFSLPNLSSRAETLSGSLTALKPLTILCVENGVDSSEFAINEVLSYGWYLTRRWRSLLESFWRTRIQEVYGVSEIPGLHALRCGECGFYHCSPLSIVEVLALDSEAPVTTGIGRVVATALYPLCQSQPMIRYDTEDVVEVHRSDCPSAEGMGFTFLGRQSNVIARRAHDGNTEVLLTPTLISEVLDDFPDVAIEPHFRVHTLGLKTSFGWQKFAVSSCEGKAGEMRVRLALELRWPSAQYPDAARELRRQIQTRLLAGSGALWRAVEDATVALDIGFHDPGSTDYVELI